MPLHTPPVIDERDGFATFLAQQHDHLRAVAYGLDDARAAQRSTVSEITIMWLLKHLTAVQLNWLDGALAAPTPLTQEQNETIVARFAPVAAEDTLASLLADFDASCSTVLQGIRELDPDTPLPVPQAPWFPRDVEHWSIRWVWLHLLQEFARHNGHGEIIRESIDGATAYPLMLALNDEPGTEFLRPWRPEDSVPGSANQDAQRPV